MSIASNVMIAEAYRLEAADAAARGDTALAIERYKLFVQRSKGLSTLIIGDSHVSTFSDVPRAGILWLGSVTMHRVRRDAAQLIRVGDVAKKGLTSILFVFGEIDCRNHINAQATAKGLSIQTVVEDLVAGYLAALGKIVEGVNAKVIVCTPPAPHDIPPYSPSYKLVHEILEPLETRVKVTACLAETIRSLAPKHGYAVLDLYRNTANEEGVMLETFNEDDIHVYGPEGRELAARLLGKLSPRNPILKFLGR